MADETEKAKALEATVRSPRQIWRCPRCGWTWDPDEVIVDSQGNRASLLDRTADQGMIMYKHLRCQTYLVLYNRA